MREEASSGNHTTLDCGHSPTPRSHEWPDIATSHDGRTMCDACAHEEEVKYIATHDHGFGYLVSNPEPDSWLFIISSFYGGFIAHVTRHKESSRGGVSNAREVRFRAVTPDGREWWGTSPGKNMYARMHACSKSKVEGGGR